ncbi:complex I assembly factor TIMMDC1, mitochondrial-like [Crassostrea virginica]
MAADDKAPMEGSPASDETVVEKESLFSRLGSFWNRAPQENDTVSLFSPVSQGQLSPITDEMVEKFIANETGLDRLKVMYSIDPYTGLSADMHNVLSIAGPVTFFSGIIIAGLRYPRAKEEFLRSSERGLVKFQRQNLRIARRYKYDTILLDLFRTGFKAAFKFGGFFTCIFMVNQSLATYNNKSSPLYYGAGGVVAGALNKFADGVRAMAAGGTIAGLLGLVYGGAFYIFQNQFNMTQDQFHWEDVRRRLEVGFIQPTKTEKKDIKEEKSS